MSKPSQANENPILAKLACVSRPDPDQECRHIYEICFFYQFLAAFVQALPCTWEQGLHFEKCDL